MTYGELPATGLYIVLSIVVVWSAILTAQIADVRKRERSDWREEARRLRKFAAWLLRIAKAGAGQMAVVLALAAWQAFDNRPPERGVLETWWSMAHIVVHLGLILFLLLFLVKWFRSMEKAPRRPIEPRLKRRRT